MLSLASEHYQFFQDLKPFSHIQAHLGSCFVLPNVVSYSPL